MFGAFGRDLALLRAASLREEAERSASRRPVRPRVAVGRVVVRLGARLMGAPRRDALAALEGRRA